MIQHLIVSILLGWFAFITPTEYNTFETNSNGVQTEEFTPNQNVKGGDTRPTNGRSKDGDVL